MARNLESMSRPAQLLGAPETDDITAARIVSQQRSKRRWLAIVLMIFAFVAARDAVAISQGQGWFSFRLPAGSFHFLPAMILIVVMVAVLAGPYLGLGRSPHMLIDPKEVDCSLSDIYGADVLVGELRQLLDEYRHFHQLETRFGAKPPKAVLFEGPPGTGKTMAAQAIAREAGVPFLFVSASSLQSMYYGQTNRKLRTFFAALRKQAKKYGGAIGFIEEFDAIGAARRGLGQGSHGEGVAGVVGELLVQLQSFEPKSGTRGIAFRLKKLKLFFASEETLGVREASISPRFLLLAATNRVADLDPAIIRPGRFDRTITFDLPSSRSRGQIIKGLLMARSLDGEIGVSEADVDSLIAQTTSMSQAALNRLVEEAGILAWRSGSQTISAQHLTESLARVSLGLNEGSPYGHEQKLRIAVHEAGHAVFAWFGRKGTNVELVSVNKRGSSLGLTASVEVDDAFIRTKSDLLADIRVTLAGMVAEEQLLGEASSGAAGDLEVATKAAMAFVGRYGLGGSLISIEALTKEASLFGIAANDSPLRREIESLLNRSKEEVERDLATRRSQLWDVVNELMTREELNRDELKKILGSSASDEFLLARESG